MKDHKEEQRPLWIGEGMNRERVIAAVDEAFDGLVNARIEFSWDQEPHVHGWRPMTGDELKAARERARKARIAAAARKAKNEDEERKELARLLKKYGNG